MLFSIVDILMVERISNAPIKRATFDYATFDYAQVADWVKLMGHLCKQFQEIQLQDYYALPYIFHSSDSFYKLYRSLGFSLYHECTNIFLIGIPEIPQPDRISHLSEL